MSNLRSPQFRRFINFNEEPVTIYRRDDTTSSNYGSSITYSQQPTTRYVYFAGVSESEQISDAGERQSMRLVAYSVPSEDIQVDDRLDHGGERFEVVYKVGKPNDTDPAVNRYELKRIVE